MFNNYLSTFVILVYWFNKFCTTPSIINFNRRDFKNKEIDSIAFYVYPFVLFCFLSEKGYSNKRLSSILLYEVKLCCKSSIDICLRQYMNNVKFKEEIIHVYLNG